MKAETCMDALQGFGIHAFESDYEQAPTLYDKSTPGLGSVLKAAVLMAR